MFENHDDNDNFEKKILDHISMYSDDPMTKPELVNHLYNNMSKNVDVASMVRVKRVGKDLDDLFWSFGKIHGLENIAFADIGELEATKGNPALIQELVNKINGGLRNLSNPDQTYA